MIALAKAAADPAGHYARPDVTRLLLNPRPAARVESFGPRFEVVQDQQAEPPAQAADAAE